MKERDYFKLLWSGCQCNSLTFCNPIGNFPMISDDLVNSYHLLLCALDLVYGNALQCSNRKELVNPNFKGKFICETFDNPCFHKILLLGIVPKSRSASIRGPSIRTLRHGTVQSA